MDEDLYTTVKIEAVSIDRDGLHNKAELEAEDEEGQADEKRTQPKDDEGKKARKDHPKTKKKKFRYESKFDRQASSRRQKAKKAGRFG